MLRGVLAFFWIALACVSGVYLYSALANPAALDGQLANPLPVGSGDMTSAVNGSGARPGSSRPWRSHRRTRKNRPDATPTSRRS